MKRLRNSFMRICLLLLFLLLPSAMLYSHQATDVYDDCKKIEAVVNIISEAISIGAPTYNEGNHIGCYRIYEGAAYKILYKYGSKCKDVKSTLEDALEKSYGDYSASDKAWIMRMAFDKILGVPTRTTKISEG